jgi:hypothetical protein
VSKLTIENARLELLQNNDEIVQLTITDPNNLVAGVPQPFDLTPSTISVVLVIKTGPTTPDSDPATLSFTATKTNPTKGICQATIPAANTGVVGRRWWRADVVQSAPVARRTITFGPQETVAV